MTEAAGTVLDSENLFPPDWHRARKEALYRVLSSTFQQVPSWRLGGSDKQQCHPDFWCQGLIVLSLSQRPLIYLRMSLEARFRGAGSSSSVPRFSRPSFLIKETGSSLPHLPSFMGKRGGEGVPTVIE